ncbi:MAG TPA: glycosyltransferase family 2 protein, partial [Rhodothermales bacterium]
MSVVICAYTMDRWELLRAAVRSVATQRPPVGELVLVIDHNEELERRARAELPEARVVPNRYRRGLSGARNTGIDETNCPLIAFLDDDAEACAGWAASLAEAYSTPPVIGVGGLSEAAWVGSRPSWFPAEFDWVVGCSYRGLPDEPAPVRNMIGSNMSFRREVFDRVGAFNPDVGRIGLTPVGCEETELCIRAALAIPGAT